MTQPAGRPGKVWPPVGTSVCPCSPGPAAPGGGRARAVVLALAVHALAALGLDRVTSLALLAVLVRRLPDRRGTRH